MKRRLSVLDSAPDPFVRTRSRQELLTIQQFVTQGLSAHNEADFWKLIAERNNDLAVVREILEAKPKKEFFDYLYAVFQRPEEEVSEEADRFIKNLFFKFVDDRLLQEDVAMLRDAASFAQSYKKVIEACSHRFVLEELVLSGNLLVLQSQVSLLEALGPRVIHEFLKAHPEVVELKSENPEIKKFVLLCQMFKAHARLALICPEGWWSSLVVDSELMPLPSRDFLEYEKFIQSFLTEDEKERCLHPDIKFFDRRGESIDKDLNLRGSPAIFVCEGRTEGALELIIIFKNTLYRIQSKNSQRSLQIYQLPERHRFSKIDLGHNPIHVFLRDLSEPELVEFKTVMPSDNKKESLLWCLEMLYSVLYLISRQQQLEMEARNTSNPVLKGDHKIFSDTMAVSRAAARVSQARWEAGVFYGALSKRIRGSVIESYLTIKQQVSHKISDPLLMKAAEIFKEALVIEKETPIVSYLKKAIDYGDLDAVEYWVNELLKKSEPLADFYEGLLAYAFQKAVFASGSQEEDSSFETAIKILACLVNKTNVTKANHWQAFVLACPKPALVDDARWAKVLEASHSCDQGLLTSVHRMLTRKCSSMNHPAQNSSQSSSYNASSLGSLFLEDFSSIVGVKGNPQPVQRTLSMVEARAMPNHSTPGSEEAPAYPQGMAAMQGTFLQPVSHGMLRRSQTSMSGVSASAEDGEPSLKRRRTMRPGMI